LARFGAAIWLAPAAERSGGMLEAAQWDEAFHRTLVQAVGNHEIARVYRAVTRRIRIIRRPDITRQPRIDATCDEDAEILRAITRQRGDQAALLLRTHIQTSQTEVPRITLHQMSLARQPVVVPFLSHPGTLSASTPSAAQAPRESKIEVKAAASRCNTCVSSYEFRSAKRNCAARGSPFLQHKFIVHAHRRVV
jgi:hypothetical protein